MPENHDTFLDGNELIVEAIEKYRTSSSEENLIAILETIRQRMHADGHFILPVLVNEEDQTQFAFRTLQTNDGKVWNVAFTSQDEFEKGSPSQVLSYFIDSSLKFSLDSEAEGFVINPWSHAFLLTNELISMIFKADGDVEYSVPEDPITPELLEDGSFLKKATEICNRNRTQLNMIKLAKILRDSWVWVPCTAVMSDADRERWNKAVTEAIDKGDPDSIVGQEFVSHDEIRMVPDILQNGEEFFFPVFTSVEEMGDAAKNHSQLQKHFLEAIKMACACEEDVAGILINPFSSGMVIEKKVWNIVENMKSRIVEDDE